MTIRRRRTVWCWGLLAMVAAPEAMACDGVQIASLTTQAERYEARHELGEAIRVRTTLAACPRTADSQTNSLALARNHAAIGDFEHAATLVEDTAREGVPDAALLAAMDAATEQRLALGHLAQATADARWLLAHDTGTARALDVGAAIERAHHWRDAHRWYQTLATAHRPRTERDLQARAWVGAGRSLDALGLTRDGDRARRRAMQLGRSDLGRSLPVAEIEGSQTEHLTEHGSMVEPFVYDPTARLLSPREEHLVDALAEALFVGTRHEVERCHRRRLVIPAGLDPVAFYRWEITSHAGWAASRMACTRRALKRASWVEALGVPRWTVAAAGLAAQAYFVHVSEVATLDRPPFTYGNARAFRRYLQAAGQYSSDDEGAFE